MDHAEDFSISHNAKHSSRMDNAQKTNLDDDPTVQAGKAAKEMNDADRKPGQFEQASYVSGDHEGKEENAPQVSSEQ